MSFLIWVIVSAIVGLIVGGVTGLSIIGWAAGILLFVLGIPGLIIAMITESVHGEVSYAQDRADYRQLMSDINADIRAEEEDRCSNIFNDNRQIHLHGSIGSLGSLGSGGSDNSNNSNKEKSTDYIRYLN